MMKLNAGAGINVLLLLFFAMLFSGVLPFIGQAKNVSNYSDLITDSRPLGQANSKRVLIGTYPVDNWIQESHYWHKIVEAAKDNPALQEALERAKVLYELSKKNDDGPVMHHPV